ncbi:MAG TPA: pyridoxamine 5'-phosphate oxidase family protein [Chroococcales cyanobacterium]
MNTKTQQLQEFMEVRFLCVISTVGEDSRPESAYVGYTSNAHREIIIGTSNQSRKYQNVTRNKSVAIVIADTTGEVQYEGEAEVITPDTYDKLIAENSFKALPGLEKYRNDPTQVYLHVRPTWVRFILHGDPDQIEEFTEFK